MDTTTIKNFKLPDKIGASAITLIVAGAALYGLWLIEPILIQLAENTLYLGGMALVLVLGGMTLWQSRDAIWYWQQNQVRAIRRSIIADDPVGILKSVINRMSAKEEELTDNITKARAALNRLKKQRDDFSAKADNEKGMASVAQGQHKPDEDVEQHVIAAGRWDKAAGSTKPMIDMLTEMAAKFQDALIICRRSIADATNQSEVLDATLAAMKEGQATVKGFRRFMGRNPEMQMQKEAVDEIELQASQAEASIDQFLQDITPMLEANNLQQQADAKVAMAKFGGFLKQAPQGALPTGGTVDGSVIAQPRETVQK